MQKTEYLEDETKGDRPQLVGREDEREEERRTESDTKSATRTSIFSKNKNMLILNVYN